MARYYEFVKNIDDINHTYQSSKVYFNSGVDTDGM